MANLTNSGGSISFREIQYPWLKSVYAISFLFKKSTSFYNRRHAKILTAIVSQFTSSYVFNWAKHFPGVSLKYPPSFDGRIVLYTTEKVVRDYFSWRQADSEYLSLELMPRGWREHAG